METKYVGNKFGNEKLETKYVGDKNDMLILNLDYFDSEFCPYNTLDKGPFGPFYRYTFGKLRIYNLSSRVLDAVDQLFHSLSQDKDRSLEVNEYL